MLINRLSLNSQSWVWKKVVAGRGWGRAGEGRRVGGLPDRPPFPFPARPRQAHRPGGGPRGPGPGRHGGHAAGGQPGDGEQVRGIWVQRAAQRPHLPGQDHPGLQAQKVSTWHSSQAPPGPAPALWAPGARTCRQAPRAQCARPAPLWCLCCRWVAGVLSTQTCAGPRAGLRLAAAPHKDTGEARWDRGAHSLVWRPPSKAVCHPSRTPGPPAPSLPPAVALPRGRLCKRCILCGSSLGTLAGVKGEQNAIFSGHHSLSRSLQAGTWAGKERQAWPGSSLALLAESLGRGGGPWALEGPSALGPGPGGWARGRAGPAANHGDSGGGGGRF